MGKKKKTLKAMKKQKEEFISSQVSLILYGENAPDMNNFLRGDAIIEPSYVAKEIEARVVKGDRKYEIAHYRHDVLKDILSYLKIPGRSSLNTKMDMAKAIVKYFKKKNNL